MDKALGTFMKNKSKETRAFMSGIYHFKLELVVIIVNILWVVYFLRFEKKVFPINGHELSERNLEVIEQDETMAGPWVIEWIPHNEDRFDFDGFQTEKEAVDFKNGYIKSYWVEVNNYDPLNLRILGS